MYFVFLSESVVFKLNMKAILISVLTVSTLTLHAQDSTYHYAGWGKPGSAQSVPLTLLTGKAYTQITLKDDKPTLIKRFDKTHELHESIKNEYDEYGNHYSSQRLDQLGHVREINIFQNDPDEMALFRTIFGNTFVPVNSNFMIRREYNEFERETGYFILDVGGRLLYSRVTHYREDRRKAKEVLRDDLAGKLLLERRYKYIDAENRTVLEEFDTRGKLVQRVVLFDHHDILEE